MNLTDLVKINNAWVCRDFKVSDFQANVTFAQED